jgi:hypothetical protein
MRHLRHHHPFTVIRLVIAGLLTLVVAASASSAHAGGWAVATLDEIPAATAGESLDVGFMILQHGRTPAVLESGVGIELVLADGSTQLFEAVADGVPGHYVATVTFPAEAGSYRWIAHMDWFGTYELGSITVAAPTSPPAISSDGGSSIWPDLRWVTLAASLVLGGVAIADVLVTRRRRRTAAA